MSVTETTRSKGMSCGSKSLRAGGASIVPVLGMFAVVAASHPPVSFFVVVAVGYLVCALVAILFAIANFVQYARGREDSILPGIGGILLSLFPLVLTFVGILDGSFGHCGGDYPRAGSVSPPAACPGPA